ncbi:UNVERIFIED_CONTAM: LRR receptor-like serine/threonine-protein kinase ERECTA [Sesamum calycinum]|uniref:non-specific serine/threonine protein kinase n=1 Tax=Sesamum calycinum TaxID=2727403 RepID=A0AAW2QX80_9LAMI
MYCKLVYEKWAMANCFRKHVLVGFLLVFLSSASVDSDDGAILLEVKKSFRDVDNVLYDWTDTPSSDYCVWRGITCDNVTFNGCTVSNLSGLNLDGEISPAFGQLKGLVSIDLRGNRLSGQIPDEIGDCSALESLDLSFNELYGDIPFSMSKLKQLENLILKNNKLIGPIPSTLSQIPNLKILDLAQNKLSGEIPRLLYWNEVLQYLGLRGNNLQGTLSPDMCQLTGLWYFDVRNNSLSGSIPDNIGNCTAFQVLDLSYNNFTGEIPFNIGFLQVATLSLQNNRFSGQIPSVIGLMQALAVLDLSYNMLSGTIPPILGNLTYTEKLYLHGNKLTGPIPAELGNMTKLHYLELNDNQLTGHIPPELGKLTDLFDLNVANNHLEGPIPDNLSSCTNLNSLNVHGNKLNGTVPLAFQKLESMTYLNLSSNNLQGPIPIELSRIGNLDTLDLSNNRISGYIPSPLGDLEHLLKLNLSNNGLSGVIPAEFGNLRSVMEIDLSNNRLSGPIPQELGQLQNVFLLKLENNNISGDVMSLANCLSLTVLNVSYNNLLDIFLQEITSQGFHLTVSISKAAILGIALGALVILLMILIAACRPHNPKSIMDGTLEKPGTTKKKKLDWGTRLRIALGAAQGLAYLHHDCSPRIIHRDVKSSNILLDKDYEAHLTDFGIAKSLCTSKTHTSTYLMGTIGYIDPEYARTSRLTEKSDVYSYGIVLLELLTGRKPVDNESNLHHLILTKAGNNSVMDTVDPEISETCKDLGEVKKVFQLALLCTKKQPLDRPTMHEVVRVLGTLMPPPEAKTFAPILPAPLPSSKVQCYVDEYANLKTPHLVNCSSMSTSDAQLFLKFGEVISQNSVS